MAPAAHGGGIAAALGLAELDIAAGHSQLVRLGPLTPLSLRHTAASLAIAAGANVKVVQTMLDHKSATMTLDLYGHLFADQLDEVAHAMDAARMSAHDHADFLLTNSPNIYPLTRE